MSMGAASRAWPRNPVQFALETKATCSRGKIITYDLDPVAITESFFIAKAKRFLILKRAGELLRSGFLLKASCEVLYKRCPLVIEEKTKAWNSDVGCHHHPGTILLGMRPEIEIRSSTVLSVVCSWLSSEITSILFATANTPGLPILLKSDGKVPNEGAFQKCPHKHFKCFV